MADKKPSEASVSLRRQLDQLEEARIQLLDVHEDLSGRTREELENEVRRLRADINKASWGLLAGIPATRVPTALRDAAGGGCWEDGAIPDVLAALAPGSGRDAAAEGGGEPAGRLHVTPRNRSPEPWLRRLWPAA